MQNWSDSRYSSLSHPSLARGFQLQKPKNKTNTSEKETSFLDLNIKIIGSDIHTSVYEKNAMTSDFLLLIWFKRCIKIDINIDSLPVQPGAPPNFYLFFLQSCLHILSKIFRRTAKQPILELGWIKCWSQKKIQKSYYNILNPRILTK